jgi:hypothetical protein
MWTLTNVLDVVTMRDGTRIILSDADPVWVGTEPPDPSPPGNRIIRTDAGDVLGDQAGNRIVALVEQGT